MSAHSVHPPLPGIPDFGAGDFHDDLLRLLRRTPANMRPAVGKLFSYSMTDDSIFGISSVVELKAKLYEVAPQRREISLSPTVARQILGYGIRNETISGVKYCIFYPVDDVRAETFYIPVKNQHEGVYIENKKNLFLTFLMRACVKLADRFGIDDSLIPEADMDRYRATSGKGGKFRTLLVVKADAHGLIRIAYGETSRVAYDLKGATQARMSNGSIVPMDSQFVDMMKSAKLILDRSGTIKLGDGVRATGSGPASFDGGVPDPTPETLDHVIGLLAVQESSFRKRYNMYVVNPTKGKTQINPSADPDYGVHPDILEHNAMREITKWGESKKRGSSHIGLASGPVDATQQARLLGLPAPVPLFPAGRPVGPPDARFQRDGKGRSAEQRALCETLQRSSMM